MKNKEIPMPQVCGGSVDNRISGLSENIESNDIISFSVTNNMMNMLGDLKYRYVSLFAVKMNNDKTYIVYKTERNAESTIAITDYRLLEKLQLLVREYNLSRNNGCSHYVNGLPDNFGGDINIRYSSGERIYRSDNQGSVLSPDAAEKMAELFIEASQDHYCRHNRYNERLVSFDYCENTPKDESYILYQLRKADKAYLLYRESSYPKYSEQIYQKKKEVSEEVIKKLESIFYNNWLHGHEKFVVEEKQDAYSIVTLTFRFADGSSYIVKDNLNLPIYTNNLGFNIYMYLEEQMKKIEE